jgi:arsenite methyltransferase
MTGEEVEAMLSMLRSTRDCVLERARVAPGATLVDVGAGTGLLTLGAIERVGPNGDVVAVDVSADALEELRRQCAAANVAYLIGHAEILPLMDRSIDIVVTRSVLIYVRPKVEASREFFRVLRHGGRLSIFEPINRRNRRLTELVDFCDLADRVADWETSRYANADDPMLNFDADDLAHLFADAGFRSIATTVRETEQEIRADQFLNAVGAPGRRSLLAEWSDTFSPVEVDLLAASVRRQGIVSTSWSGLFLSAEKP